MIIRKIEGGHWPWCSPPRTAMVLQLKQLRAGKAVGETNISFARNSKTIDVVS